MERTRKVFIPNKGGHNYRDAERFGELIYVTEGNINRFAVSNIYRAFIDAMVDSHSNDFFVPTSMNVLNSIGAGVFVRKHGTLNLLLYKDGAYTARELDIDSLLNI